MVKMIDKADILLMEGLTVPVYPKKSTALTKLSLPSNEACVSVVPVFQALWGSSSGNMTITELKLLTESHSIWCPCC